MISPGNYESCPYGVMGVFEAIQKSAGMETRPT